MICQGLTREQSNALYLEVLESADTEALRRLCKEDLFFLLTQAFKRRDADHDWLYDRCREVELNPDGYLDLWARDHYKSTIITFAKTIQDILNDPDVTIGIFSHTRPIAKGFMDQIKRELESNRFLQNLFPDILYKNPQTEAPKWALDSGLIVKRKTNPKECTVEAWGLVDGQPISKHFKIRVYDDVVTMDSVSTPEQIKKTTAALAMSSNLGTKNGIARMIGTRYHMHDTYHEVIKDGIAIPRIHTATHNGKMDGEPVFLNAEQLAKKRKEMGPYIFGTQMLQNPVADNAMSFKPEWRMYYKTINPKGWNLYIIVDPASKKKKSSDYTVMNVIGLAPDNNYYLIKAIRDRLNLAERARKLFELHREFSEYSLTVAYEEYGMQADIEHIKYVQEQENYRFDITPLGGRVAKEDRIKALIPVYEQKRFFLPETLPYHNYEKKRLDYVEEFIRDEYDAFPVCAHDDMLDCMARILDPDLGAKFPKIILQPEVYESYSGDHSWMG